MALPVRPCYSLKWHGHGVHLNSSISGLYRSDAFTDVVLATTDGRFVSAHQFVLSACSLYLHKMFLVAGSSSKNNSKIIVVLPSEISYATFNILLQYIYRGEAIVNQEQLPSIMKAAELLQVRGLCPGKEKPDTRANGSSVLKQHHKNGSESKNNSEVIKLNHRVLIPEVRYNSDPVGANVECESDINKISKNTSNTISGPPPLASPARKKQKGSLEESLLNHKKDNEINVVEESILENMIVGQEVQVKEEPIDWEEQKSNDENNTIVKQEMISEEEIEIEEDNCYVPLTCDLCQETFSTPALWVRHIEQSHPSTALSSGKQSSVDDGTGEYPPLHCELCQQMFSVPAEWVRHIQSHSEQQLASTHESVETPHSNRGRIECTVCGKVLGSQASLLNHIRTHTGERPYICKLCGREFNVKSNFLRHLRTLHNQLLNSVSLD